MRFMTVGFTDDPGPGRGVKRGGFGMRRDKAIPVRTDGRVQDIQVLYLKIDTAAVS